ncbi:MAG: ABC transporter ATP-binding protein [Bacteroidales bacterium]|nr:ABC transporter ATP-binding protein [Bacteroidales bacterium]
MKELFGFLKRFALPYKKTIGISLIFNLLTAILTLFSFAVIVPILEMLFGLSVADHPYTAPGTAPLKDVLVNNFYYYVQQIINHYGASTALAGLAFLLVVMTLLKVGTAYLSEYFTIPMRNGVVRDIRNAMYNKILSLPIGFFTQEKKGDIIARISGDVTEVENSIMSGIYSIFKYPIMIVTCLGMMIYISWQLTLFVFILLPIMGYVMGTVGKKLKAKSLRVQQLWGDILSTTEESLGGLRVIKAFNAETQMKHRFEKETMDYLRASNSMLRRQALAHPMSEFLGTIAVAVVLWFGGTLILDGTTTIEAPTFIYYMGLFYSIINPAKDLSKTTYAMQKGVASLQRIDKILEAENTIKNPLNPIPVEATAGDKPVISLKNVTFSYDGEQDVLKDISIDIKEGETVAIVGQSGSGKSTLLDLVPRFWDVDEGTIEIYGHNIKEYDVKELRKLMGNVNQEAILFNDTIYNNIIFGAGDVSREEVENAAKIANAHDFITATQDGYDTVIGDRGCRLSGGQRQRISIARSILRNPAILILDEATSALDTESERAVQEALDRLMRDRTTVVVAHRLSTIMNADHIYVISDGKIVEDGTHTELMEKGGVYNRLVTLQQVS